MTEKEKKMIVYGHNFCAQAVSLRRMLRRKEIEHDYRDVARGNPHWKKELMAYANGNLSVPTVVFPDGTVLVEPFNNEVLDHLGMKEPGFMEKVSSLFKRG